MKSWLIFLTSLTLFLHMICSGCNRCAGNNCNITTGNAVFGINICTGGTQGAGPIQSESRTLPAFSQIELTNSVDVRVRIQPVQQVTLEAQGNLLALIQTEVRGHRLIISTKESFCSREKILLRITIPHLTEVHLASSGNVIADGISESNFYASVESSGDLTITGSAQQLTALLKSSGDLHAASFQVEHADIRLKSSGDASLAVNGDVKATIESSGDLSLLGKATKLTAILSSSGDLHAEALQADDANIQVSSSGDATVCVQGEAVGETSSSGDIMLLCHPQVVRVRKSSSGDVLIH